jgi:nitrogen regulatory protein PII
VTEIFGEEQVKFHFITLGEGTAGSDIMALLGLNSIDKALICCLVPETSARPMLSVLSEKLQLAKPGRGIAFTMPLSGINNAALRLITKDYEPEGDEGNMDSDKQTARYDMILSIINQGHVDELMSAANAAGARGGTVLHGRKVGDEEDVKFFGISLQVEKDIIAILTTHEKKNDIMRAINSACGISTESQGVIIAMPVDDIEGLKSVTEAAEPEAE